LAFPDFGSILMSVSGGLSPELERTMRSLIFRLPLCPTEAVIQYPQLELFMEKQLFNDPRTQPEGLDVSLLVPDLLGFLYWGKEVYRTMHSLERGDKSEAVCRNIPKWNCGNHAYIPFIAYAVLKQDLDIIDAVFEEADFVTIACSLAYLFMRYDSECPSYKNWLDKALVQDFFQENPAPYRECNGSGLMPCDLLLRLHRQVRRYIRRLIRHQQRICRYWKY
jgi:hypothetical protein